MHRMERKSEYFTSLSKEAQIRYEEKVVVRGLKIDPYAIESWTEAPEVIPDVHWSDMMLYMIATPSPYTCEAIKVSSLDL